MRTVLFIYLALAPGTEAWASEKPKSAPPQKYAVLISGGYTQYNFDSEPWHTENLKAMREALIARGVPAENILVLNADGSANTSGPPPSPADRIANHQNIDAAFAEIRGKIKGGDQLLVTMTDHGGTEHMGIWNGKAYTVGQLERQLNLLPKSTQVHLVASFCFSGWFARKITRENTCVYTRTDEYSLSISYSTHKNFIALFADAIKSGKTMDHAFEKAMKKEWYNGLNKTHNSSLTQLLAIPERTHADVLRPNESAAKSNCPRPSGVIDEFTQNISRSFGDVLKRISMSEGDYDEYLVLRKEAESAKSQLRSLRARYEKLTEKEKRIQLGSYTQSAEYYLYHIEAFEKLEGRISGLANSETAFRKRATPTELKRLANLKKCGAAVY